MAEQPKPEIHPESKEDRRIKDIDTAQEIAENVHIQIKDKVNELYKLAQLATEKGLNEQAEKVYHGIREVVKNNEIEQNKYDEILKKLIDFSIEFITTGEYTDALSSFSVDPRDGGAVFNYISQALKKTPSEIVGESTGSLYIEVARKRTSQYNDESLCVVQNSSSWGALGLTVVSNFKAQAS